METNKEIIKQMGDELREEILLDINRRIERTLRRRFLLRASAIAASIALLVGISAHLAYQRGYEQRNSSLVETTSPLGTRSTIILPDGSRALLNAGTTLAYPNTFTGERREIRVRGEAFLEVTPDKHHPFIVNAGEAKVRVVGTKFNVKAYEEDNDIEITLQEGRINVELEGHKSSIALLPGHLLTFDKTKGNFSREKVNPDDYTAWTSGKLYFNNESFENIVKCLERKFNVKIDIADAALRKISFTGDFIRGENIEQILAVITSNRNIRYSIDGEHISISSVGSDKKISNK